MQGPWGRSLLAAALAASLLALTTPCYAQQDEPQGFIRISNGRFVDDVCNEYLFSGWNAWRVLDNALSDPSYITRRFQQAQAARLNLMRFFIAGDEGGPVLATVPGQLDDSVARGLDFVLAEAPKYGIKVTPVFLNLWKKNGGVPKFEEWCGTAGLNTKPRPDLDLRLEPVLNETEGLQTPYDWLVSSKCRDQVKAYMSSVVNRRNSITGLLFKDDPAIFSWNIMNEPRCKYCGPEAVDSWYGEMADHLRSVDPNHLITTGEEGFFAEGDPMAGADPNDGNQWAIRSGQDFRIVKKKTMLPISVASCPPGHRLWPAVDRCAQPGGGPAGQAAGAGGVWQGCGRRQYHQPSGPLVRPGQQCRGRLARQRRPAARLALLAVGWRDWHTWRQRRALGRHHVWHHTAILPQDGCHRAHACARLHAARQRHQRRRSSCRPDCAARNPQQLQWHQPWLCDAAAQRRLPASRAQAAAQLR